MSDFEKFLFISKKHVWVKCKGFFAKSMIFLSLNPSMVVIEFARMGGSITF